jgi:glycosyltransferase involved in cell wall biosynthesis
MQFFSDSAYLHRALSGSTAIEHTLIETGNSWLAPWHLFWTVRRADVVLLDNSYPHLFGFCLLSAIFPRRFMLVSLDILLRKPASFKQRVACSAKSQLLRAVDLFLLYFKDTRGYEAWYGIDPERTRYVPFKVNDWETFRNDASDPDSGSYVLCAGQTLRDHTTFIDAIGRTRLPGVLLVPNATMLKAHGSGSVSGLSLPGNLRLIVHNDGRHATFLEWIRNAKIVVIPRFRSDIASTGISTYLNAMAATRCVIISRGPGVEDVLALQQAIAVDPENPDQLAEAIKLAWNDADVRRRVALAGRAYAAQLEGVERLWADVLRIVQEEHNRRVRVDDAPTGGD